MGGVVTRIALPLLLAQLASHVIIWYCHTFSQFINILWPFHFGFFEVLDV